MIGRLVVLALAVMVAATACADLTSPGLEVNGAEVGRGDIDGLITDVVEHTNLSESYLPVGNGTVVRGRQPDAAADAMFLLVQDELVRAELAERGLSVSDEDRGNASLQIADLAPSSLADRLEPIFARQRALVRAFEESGQDPNAWLIAELEEAEISVDPRYGTWDADEFRLVAPVAPALSP